MFEEHLNRLKQSAKYFRFPFYEDRVKTCLLHFAQQHNLGEYKIRLLLDKDGAVQIDAQSLRLPPEPLKVTLADEALNKDNPFLYHKTTNRLIYDQFRTRFPHVFDILLKNEDGELTEFTNGNLVLDIDGKLWTPPIQSGLLAGTYRERLIKEGKIHEKVLTAADLKRCRKIWFINSVRNWLPVQLV